MVAWFGAYPCKLAVLLREHSKIVTLDYLDLRRSVQSKNLQTLDEAPFREIQQAIPEVESNPKTILPVHVNTLGKKIHFSQEPVKQAFGEAPLRQALGEAPLRQVLGKAPLRQDNPTHYSPLGALPNAKNLTISNVPKPNKKRRRSEESPVPYSPTKIKKPNGVEMKTYPKTINFDLIDDFCAFCEEYKEKFALNSELLKECISQPQRIPRFQNEEALGMECFISDYNCSVQVVSLKSEILVKFSKLNQ